MLLFLASHTVNRTIQRLPASTKGGLKIKITTYFTVNKLKN